MTNEGIGGFDSVNLTVKTNNNGPNNHCDYFPVYGEWHIVARRH